MLFWKTISNNNQELRSTIKNKVIFAIVGINYFSFFPILFIKEIRINYSNSLQAKRQSRARF
jgi:hypothetical protein